MLNRSKTTVFMSALLILALLSLGACKSDDNPTSPGGDNGGSDVIDIAGEWSIEEDVDGTACGDGTYQNNYTATVTQVGSTFVVTTPFGTFAGVIDGTSISWTGSFQDDGGTTTIDTSNLSVSTDGATLSGTFEWTYTPFDGSASCSGTSNVGGTKTPTTDTGVSGTWSISESVNPGSCDFDAYMDTYTITVVQNGAAITVTTTDATYYGTLNGQSLTWAGTTTDEEGTVALNMSITVSVDGTSLSGGSTWVWTDLDGNSCSGTTQVTGTKN